MTMKAIELAAQVAVSPVPAAKASHVETPALPRVVSRWFTAVRRALSRYAAENEKAWERMVDAQARDPNRY